MLMQWSHETMFAIVIFKIFRQLSLPLDPAADFRPSDPLVLHPSIISKPATDL